MSGGARRKRRPTEEHAQAADDAELPEPAEVGEYERAVGSRGSERGDDGSGAASPERINERFLDGSSAASLFRITCQEDDAEVDAVADDHRPEKRRVGIEAGDAERRERDQGEGANGRDPERQEESHGAPPPSVEQDETRQHERDDDERRRGEILNERRQLLHVDGDVAGVAEAHPGRVVVEPSQVANVVRHPREERVPEGGPGRELRRLNQEERELLVRVGEPVVLEAASVLLLGAVLGFDVAQVERFGSGLVLGVGIQAELLRDRLVSFGFEPIADGLEIGQVGIQGGVRFEEATLRANARFDGRHQRRRIGGDPCRQVVQKPFGRGEILGGARIDDDAEVAQARHPTTELVQRDHARCLARQELFDVALQVSVKADGASHRGDRQKQS